jgi:uncharacterized protein YhbP (UPF0306 family)
MNITAAVETETREARKMVERKYPAHTVAKATILQFVR